MLRLGCIVPLLTLEFAAAAPLHQLVKAERDTALKPQRGRALAAGVQTPDDSGKLVSCTSPDENGRIIIPATVTSIEPGFCGIKSLKRLEFEERSLPLSIGGSAFASSGLNHDAEDPLIIPATVFFIGDGAFKWTNDLKRLEFATRSGLQTALQIGTQTTGHFSNVFSSSEEGAGPEGKGLGCIQFPTFGYTGTYGGHTTTVAELEAGLALCPESPARIAYGVTYTSKGDPRTKTADGTETSFYLPENKLMSVFEQPPFAISYRVANPLDAAHHAGADWITEVGVAVNGAPANYVNISIVNPDTLLQSNFTREPPLVGAPLSTMRVSVGGKPLMAGVHTFPSMVIKTTFDPKKKRVGCGYVEHVDITTADLRFRVSSARAKKFAEPEMQVKALHLDVEFRHFDRAAMRGVLPELWGLAPLSEATSKLLSPQ